MGWTGIASYNAPTTQAEERAFFEKELNYKNDAGETATVVAMSKVGSCWYVAIEYAHNDATACRWYGNGTTHVGGLVIKTSRYNGEFDYKLIDEIAGPVDAEAPAKIINLLTPLNDSGATKWARDWRKACTTNRKTKKAIKSIKDGVTIRLAKPVSFGGVSVDTATATTYYTTRGRARRCYSNPLVGKFRLSPADLVGFEVVS